MRIRSRFTNYVKLDKTGGDVEALFTRFSDICRLFGFLIVRIPKTAKQAPKTSQYKHVAVYDNDWDD